MCVSDITMQRFWLGCCMTVASFSVFCGDSRAVLEESPYSRMKSVVRWYLSGFYKKPKVRTLCIHVHAQASDQTVISIYIHFRFTHTCIQSQVTSTCLHSYQVKDACAHTYTHTLYIHIHTQCCHFDIHPPVLTYTQT